MRINSAPSHLEVNPISSVPTNGKNNVNSSQEIFTSNLVCTALSKFSGSQKSWPGPKATDLLNFCLDHDQELQRRLSEAGLLSQGELNAHLTDKQLQDLNDVLRDYSRQEFAFNLTEPVSEKTSAFQHEAINKLQELLSQLNLSDKELADIYSQLKNETLPPLLSEKEHANQINIAKEFRAKGGKNSKYLVDAGIALKKRVDKMEPLLATRGMVAVATDILKKCSDALQVSEDDANKMSKDEKKQRFYACEALTDVANAIENLAEAKRFVREAATDNDALWLLDKIEGARKNLNDALKGVLDRSRKAAKWPVDRLSMQLGKLHKVLDVFCKSDWGTVLADLQEEVKELKEGTLREHICIRNANKTLAQIQPDSLKGETSSIVALLRQLCQLLEPKLQHAQDLEKHPDPMERVKAKPLAQHIKPLAIAAITTLRALEGVGVVPGKINEVKTQRAVLGQAIEQLQKVKSCSEIFVEKDKVAALTEQLWQQLSIASAKFGEFKPGGNANVGDQYEFDGYVRSQLKTAGTVISNLTLKGANQVVGLYDRMKSSTADGKKLNDLLEVRSAGLLTSLYELERHVGMLQGEAKKATGIAGRTTLKKNDYRLNTPSDLRTAACKKMKLRQEAVQHAVSLVKTHFEETQAELNAMKEECKNEYDEVLQLRNELGTEENLSSEQGRAQWKRHNKQLDALWQTITKDIPHCLEENREALDYAVKVASETAALSFSMDNLSRLDEDTLKIVPLAGKANRTVTSALRKITHREPEVFGIEQRLAKFHGKFFSDLTAGMQLKPKERDELVRKAAERIAADDCTVFDKKAYEKMIYREYELKRDGKQILPLDYRALQQQPGLAIANHFADTGLSGLGDTAISAFVRDIVGEGMNFGVMGPLVTGPWNVVRACVTTAALIHNLYKGIKQKKNSIMPGYRLQSGIVKKEVLNGGKFIFLTQSKQFLPPSARVLVNVFNMLVDINKNGFAYTLESASRNFANKEMMSVASIMIAQFGKDALDTGVELLGQMQTNNESYNGEGDRGENKVDDIARIISRGRAAMQPGESTKIDNGLSSALGMLSNLQSKLQNGLSPAEMSYLSEQLGVPPNDVAARVDALIERVRSYQKGGANQNQLVMVAPVKNNFAACVVKDDPHNRIFINRDALANSEHEVGIMLLHEMLHQEGTEDNVQKAWNDTGKNLALLEGLHLRNSDVQRNSPHHADKHVSHDGLSFYVYERAEVKAGRVFQASSISLPNNSSSVQNAAPALNGNELKIPGFEKVDIKEKNQLETLRNNLKKEMQDTERLIGQNANGDNRANNARFFKLEDYKNLVEGFQKLETEWSKNELSLDDTNKLQPRLQRNGDVGGNAHKADQVWLDQLGVGYKSILRRKIFEGRAEMLIKHHSDHYHNDKFTGTPKPFQLDLGDRASTVKDKWLISLYQKHGINPERRKCDYIAAWPIGALNYSKPGDGVDLIQITPDDLAANNIHDKIHKISGASINEYTVHYPDDYPQGLKDDLEKGIWDDFKVGFNHKMHNYPEVTNFKKNLLARAKLAFVFNRRSGEPEQKAAEIDRDLSRARPVVFGNHKVAGMFIIPDKTNANKGRLYSLDPTFKAVDIEYDASVKTLIQNNPELKKKIDEGLVGRLPAVPTSDKGVRTFVATPKKIAQQRALGHVFTKSTVETTNAESFLFNDLKERLHTNMDETTRSSSELKFQEFMEGAKFLLNAVTAEMGPELAIFATLAQVVIPMVQAKWTDDPDLAEAYTREALWSLVFAAIIHSGGNVLEHINKSELEAGIDRTVADIKRRPATAHQEVQEFTDRLDEMTSRAKNTFLVQKAKINGIDMIRYPNERVAAAKYGADAQFLSLDLNDNGAKVFLTDHETNANITSNKILDVLKRDPTGKGKIHILTGTHGNPDGVRTTSSGQSRFAQQDWSWTNTLAPEYGNRIVIHDISKPQYQSGQVGNIIKQAQEGDVVIGAFCYSRNDSEIRAALDDLHPVTSYISYEAPPGSGITEFDVFADLHKEPVPYWMRSFKTGGKYTTTGQKITFNGIEKKETFDSIFAQFKKQNRMAERRDFNVVNQSMIAKYGVDQELPAGVVIRFS
jgi:hypothetical protein